uniref:Protein a3 n=1 Tax=Mastomys natalensis cytomegalovirus 2 TaxID=2973540 RepID=A0A9Y1IR43_9BETA|nr:protein a3 [Mastomys natalensis cytomegalovirus 2]WEG69298.1 protein a3 [Mastomys natalensis cytomegalovirus 2]WEG69436.1 protein a3 [Mastomys natalensis cytomegalovirus 2]WEG69574.1 protein a3 [Mastomys natalensis cytomegalovirus 2]WEG71248.1 protein a3 [Mastomys natalensis cytomegalovirus 2]
MRSDCPRAHGRGPPVPRSRSALAVCLGLAVAILHLAAVAALTVHLATMCPRDPASCPLTPTDGAGSRPTAPVAAAAPSTARGVSGSTPTCPADWLPFGNRCLFLGLDIDTWPTARAACRAAGGDLAKFSTPELTLFTLFVPKSDYWIGLIKSTTETSWHWLDGTLLNESATPVRGGEDFAYMNAKGLGSARNYSQRCWICEKLPR